MFKITIEETRLESVHLGKRWELIGPQGQVEYGYTPETDTQKLVARTVYEQTVDGLNLTAVIATINNIKVQ